MSQPAPDVLDPHPAIPPLATITVMSTHILLALSLAHLLNDTIQSLLPAIYPLLKEHYALTYTQIGLITFTFQVTSSLLQPVVGTLTDRYPKPFSLAIGMSCTLAGLLLLSQAHSLPALCLAAGVVGMGSSVFHPEASRVAHMAAGGRHGFAQSLFQVGGNFGSSLGPLLAAWIIVPHGQGSVAWFSLLALFGIVVLARVGLWYRAQLRGGYLRKAKISQPRITLSRSRVAFTIAILIALIISKYVYLVSLTNYYTFYLIHRYGVTVQHAQVLLFVFLFAVAAGTIAGGPIGDRFGRKAVIWVSILGVAPFSLALPHLGLTGAVVCSIFAGAILASAFSAILVFAQELLPGKVGTIAGLFFGFAFGVAGVAASALGVMIDRFGIEHVFFLCGFLPLIGVLAAFLPSTAKKVEPPMKTDER